MNIFEAPNELTPLLKIHSIKEIELNANIEYTLKENLYYINIVTFFISFRVQACRDNENECGELELKVPN